MAAGPSTVDSIIIRGATVQADVADRILSAKISLTAPLTADDFAVSQMTLVITDPDLEMWNTHLLDLGASVRLGAFFGLVSTTDLQNGGDGPRIVAEARSYGIEKLRGARSRDGRNWSGLTLAQLAQQVAEPFGLTVVAEQDIPALSVIARAGADPSVPGDLGESSAQMLQRLGKEQGLVLMEAFGTLYYGRPSWLRTQLPGRKFDARHLPDTVLAITSARRTTDERGRDDRRVVLSVTQEEAAQFAPGQLLFLSGLERFSRDFLVSQVEWDPATEDPGTVTCVLPVDLPSAPTEEPLGTVNSNSAAAADPSFGRFVNALIGQESGGSYSAVNKRTGALGRYQVMPANVPAWSKQTIGRSVTAAEYLRTPALQDQVAIGILWQNYSASGPRGAAAIWYSGKATRQNDYTVVRKGEPSVGDYCDQVLERMKTAGSNLPAGYTGAGAGTGPIAGRTAAAFANLAQKQVDGSAVYVYGAEASLSNPSANAFDCSELVQWCAGRLGVTVPDGSGAQAAFCAPVSVAKAATTRGALLFHSGHVAISLGDGVHTIEAASTKSGLVNGNIAKRFTAAGLIPGLTYPADPGLRRPGQ